MSVRERIPPSAAGSVDLSATLELLASLTRYAEAGAVQPHTLAQAAQHALEEHGEDADILVAVARLHLATGHPEEAAHVLGRATRLFPGDSRVEQLLIDARRGTPRGGPPSVRPPDAGQPLSGSRPAARPAGQRTVAFRELAPASSSKVPRSSRAATGNLKLLDPNDEHRRLDRYELIGEIASGGMASVYLARLPGVAGFQRFFAIKRLHPHLADEQEFTHMFLDEARLAAAIHHPNVVPILEVGTSEAGYYLVMDYIEGDTLSGVVARAGTLPRPVALRIMLDALHGLHAAHELIDADGQRIELVHRDCSPHNILVGVDGSSRITDFGVARAASRLSITRSVTVRGKLAYLSPEQATGRALDRRSDLFSMGVILWEILAGRRLFRADSEGETLTRILVDPIPKVTDFAPDIPESVGDILATSLSREADGRFPTAADMAGALEQAVREAETPDLFVASPRDVEGYLRELLGADIASRRDAVRGWIATCSDVPSGPRSLRPGGSMAPPPKSIPAPRPGATDAEGAAPSTKRVPSGRRDEEETPAAPPARPKDETPAAAPPAPPEPAPSPPAVSEPPAAPPDPPVPEAASPPPAPADQAVPRKPRRVPVAVIALAALLVLAAIALYAVRSLG